MPITAVRKDPDTLTMTVVAEYPVPVRRLWDAYADPRQLEKFWGPPEWPATFTRHDMAVGGRSAYHMTGPGGERSAGYWEFIAVDAPRSFEVQDGFANADGSPNTELPSMRLVFLFDEVASGSRLTITTHFPSLSALEELVAMGMEDGMRAAMGQIDGVLADLAAFAAVRATEAQLLGDTVVRVSRVIRGTPAQVWEAHHDPALLRRWMLGPDGWAMPVCEVGRAPGDTYRYEWQSASTGERFGFTGQVLEAAPPYRFVTTERMLGTEGPDVINEMTLTPLEAGTLLSLVITYPDVTVRDAILGTGMTDGMEASYARLEAEVLVPA